MAHNTTSQVLIDFFTEHGTVLSYAKGHAILCAGDRTDGAHLITEGYVKVYNVDARGDSYLHIVYGPGEIFPLAWIVDHREVRVHYAAFTDCKTIRASEAALQSALSSDIAITRALMDKSILQFRLYAIRIENLQYKFARERLIYCLLFLTSRFGERRNDGSYILQAPLTQQLIGDFINLSRESVSREFERLRQMEQIHYEGPLLVIINWRQLGKEFKEPIHPEWWGLH